MNFQEHPREPESPDTGISINSWISQVQTEASQKTASLLWLYPLDFDFERDIHDESLKDVIWLKLFIRNFEQNWYSSIWKYISFNWRQVEMWTWCALVSEQYLSERWAFQWIDLSPQSEAIWQTTYRDKNWNSMRTRIYFVWAATKTKSGWVGAVAYSHEDMYQSLREILWIQDPDTKKNICIQS